MIIVIAPCFMHQTTISLESEWVGAFGNSNHDLNHQMLQIIQTYYSTNPGFAIENLWFMNHD